MEEVIDNDLIKKYLNDYIEEKDKQFSDLQKKLNISEIETKIYKKLLEEEDKSTSSNTLFVLIDESNCYNTGTYCIGVFTLESSAIKAILKLLFKDYRIIISKLSIYKVSFECPLIDNIQVISIFNDDTFIKKSHK